MKYIENRLDLNPKSEQARLLFSLPCDCIFRWQIHLHDKEEVPPMNDQGFAVAPGTQNLVAVEMSTVYAPFFAPLCFACFFSLESIASAICMHVCQTACLRPVCLLDVLEATANCSGLL